MIGLLEASSKRFDHRVLAFCLMTNHVHLEIRVGRISLSRIMQNISQRYTQWFNRRHNRCGHLFQGRYKAVMVDSDEYLLELAAYIHLNPIRAGIIDRPEQHRWSSHGAYLGKENLPWLDTDFVLTQMSQNPKKARAAFAAFVNSRLSEEHRRDFHGEKIPESRILGDDRFVEVVLAEAESVPLHKPDVHAVVAAVKRLYGLSDNDLSAQTRERKPSEARAVAAWATLELSSGKLTALAPFVGRDASTLSCAVRRIEKKRESDCRVAEIMVRLRKELLDSQPLQQY